MSDFQQLEDPSVPDQPVGEDALSADFTPRLSVPDMGSALNQQMGGEDPMTRLRTFGADMGMRAKIAEQPQFGSIKFNKDNTIDLKGLSKETFEAYNRDRQQLNEIRGAYAQEAARLQAREQQQRSNPVLALAAALGANLGQAKNMPDWVQGLAKTSAALNPTADELRNQRMALMGEQAQLAERAMSADMRGQQAVERIGYEQERLKLQEEGLNLRRELGLKTEQANKDKQAAIDFRSLMARFGSGQGSGAEVDGLLAAGKITPVEAEVLRSADARYHQKRTEQIEDAGKKEEAKYPAKVKLADHKFGQAMAKQKDQQGFSEAFAEYKTGLQTAAKQDRALKVLTPQETTKLADNRATERYLDGIDRILNDPKLKNQVGPWNPNAILPLFAKDPDYVQVQNYFNHEIPRVLIFALRGSQGGASLLRTQEGRELLRGLGAMRNMTIPQVRNVVSNIRQVVSENRRAVMDSKPEVNWDKYPDLLGSDSTYRPRTTAGAGADPLGIR